MAETMKTNDDVLRASAGRWQHRTNPAVWGGCFLVCLISAENYFRNSRRDLSLIPSKMSAARFDGKLLGVLRDNRCSALFYLPFKGRRGLQDARAASIG